MKLPRFSLSTIGFVILLLAIDFAVIRAAFGSIILEGWTLFAVFLLPMLDAVLIALYRLRRRECRTVGATGFLVSGIAATTVVFAFGVTAPDTALNMLRAVGRPVYTASVSQLTRIFGNAAMQGTGAQLTLGVAFELLFPVAFFCLPPLFVEFLGGWLARRLGLPQRIERAGIGEDYSQQGDLDASLGEQHRARAATLT
jgi:hypothetical protein